jgi:hypothetical protein
MRIPKAISHLPEKPAHGNYIFVGQQRWAHGEDLADAYREWKFHGGRVSEKFVVLDVSDDFRIYHLDGSVSASKIATVHPAG